MADEQKHEVNMDNPFGMPEFSQSEDPLARALYNVSRTPEGKTLLWGILAHSKIYDDPFAGNSTDTYQKGKRSVGLWLLALMNEHDPMMYPSLLMEVAKLSLQEDKQLAAQEDEKKT